jgi:hypothetical protein
LLTGKTVRVNILIPSEKFSQRGFFYAATLTALRIGLGCEKDTVVLVVFDCLLSTTVLDGALTIVGAAVDASPLRNPACCIC